MQFFYFSVLMLVSLVFVVQPCRADPVRVFAAASTQPVLDALSNDLKHADISVTAVYGSSAVLARQIEYGAPADIYITANTQWMDYLTNLDLIQTKTRQTISRNRLALISYKNLNLETSLNTIAQTLQGERLAVADPNSVPAGQYAKEALILTNQWTALKNSLAPTKDVTAALMLVARKEALLGIVYASDVRRSKNIKSFALFPQNSHSPITYQAAAVKGATSPNIAQFLKVLSGPQGQAAFQNAGFGAGP